MELAFGGAFDLGHTATLAGLIWAIINIWRASRDRDQRMKDQHTEMALWKNDMEHKVELLKTQGCKDTHGIEKMLKEFRQEVKNDHVETKEEISQLRAQIQKVEEVGREGRDKLYQLIEKLRTK